MENNGIGTMHIIDVPNACKNCAFCHNVFRSCDTICLLREEHIKYFDVPMSAIIPNENCWTCSLFTDFNELQACKNIKNIEEFNVLRDLGKFSSMPDLVVNMVYNFFVSDGTASNKQLTYENTIACALKIVPPMMIDLDTFDCGNLDIRLADNKKIVWKWTNEHVKQFKEEFILI